MGRIRSLASIVEGINRSEEHVIYPVGLADRLDPHEGDGGELLSRKFASLCLVRSVAAMNKTFMVRIDAGVCTITIRLFYRNICTGKVNWGSVFRARYLFFFVLFQSQYFVSRLPVDSRIP
ncbi:hypothetical protein PUN28_019606 [Cardiocondyla obscurior]|uniref:Uncharacterized protein n=1 Tax=Cardiocondyla obscurior TaxID=286306 RepID=A0AAW2EAU3_9HYME